MARRGKIEISKTDALQEVDNELDQAMSLLDDTNQRIDDVLAGLDIEVGAHDDGEEDDPVEGETALATATVEESETAQQADESGTAPSN